MSTEPERAAADPGETTDHEAGVQVSGDHVTRPNPLWLGPLYTTGMLLVGLALPGAPLAALCLYFEGTLDWPEAVQAGCWLIAVVALLGTALWVAASHLDRPTKSRARIRPRDGSGTAS